MNKNLAEYLLIFKENQRRELSPKTIARKVYETEQFLIYLESNGKNDLKNFDVTVVYKYITSLNFATQTISGIQFTLRNFFNIMFEKGLCEIDGYKVFPIIFTNKRDQILSYYQTDEIKELLLQIDPTKPNGVRDKCMLLLAAQTGLRASDILGLRHDKILWDKQIIHKIQEKTKLPVSVPLPENIKYLLIDYLKNHRPESGENYIFISEKTRKRYSDSELYVIMNKYFQKSAVVIGNRKHGPHTLRHSLAARLLENNTPMPVITGILGHKNLNTTSKYLSIDIEGLRKAALEVPTDEN